MQDGHTALYLASSEGDVEVVTALLKSSANCDTCDKVCTTFQLKSRLIIHHVITPSLFYRMD